MECWEKEHSRRKGKAVGMKALQREGSWHVGGRARRLEWLEHSEWGAGEEYGLKGERLAGTQ